MKIEIAKQDLEVILASVRLSVSSENDLSSHYLFRIRDGGVEVDSYDLRTFAGAPLITNLEGDEGDAFTVEGWRLDKWLAGVGDGVLTLSDSEKVKGEVTAKGPRSSVRFRSLDPGKWPNNDELVDTSNDLGTTSASNLARALRLMRWFVSADDTSKPELCQIEAVDGVLWATDRRALSSVQLPGLDGLNIRIPGKDVGAVIKFLTSNNPSDKVTIKHAERPLEDGGGANCTFWKEDKSFLGITQPTSKLPALNVDREAVDDVTLRLDREEFKAAVSVLSAGAPKGHESVTFSFNPKEGPEGTVHVSMPCEAGGSDDYPLSLAKVLNGDKWDSEFTIDTRYIQGIGDTFGLDTLEFGITKRGRGGFVSFRYKDVDEEVGNDYYSVVVWRT